MFTKGLTLSSEAKYYIYLSLRERLQLPERARNGVASRLRDAGLLRRPRSQDLEG
jgi:hypothetical protein